jgi:hypothetical protein
MRRWNGFRIVLLPAAIGLALLCVPEWAGASSSPQSPITRPHFSRSYVARSRWTPDRNLAVLGAGQNAVSADLAAASARARASGRQIVVSGLTTQTSTVTALPNGTEVGVSNVLPVRVHAGHGWVPVNTALRRVPVGGLAPAAIPGDAVTFSVGGTGPAAVISADGARLALSWPGRLPAPVVTGSSAVYRNVMPGINLVLTATSAATGGFTEVLEVQTAAAARDAGLAHLALRVATIGTLALRETAGGGLAAVMAGDRGAFVASPPRMWDSSSIAPGSSAIRLSSEVRAAAASARTAGAGLAAPGSGPMVSSPAGPAGGARLAAVATSVASSGRVLSLAPDERMLRSPTTRFPVFIDPGFTTVTGTGGEQAFDPVQSECTGSHYNDKTDYPVSPVGYDDFQQSDCGYEDTDYSLYQVGLPSGAFAADAVILSASFQTAEAYSSSCSTTPSVTTTWIGGINKYTGWPGPGAVDGNSNATATVGPDPGSCDNTADFSKTVAAGFNVLTDLNNIGGSPSNITFRLWEPNDTNEDDHKQFTDNPDIQVIWTDTPNNPINMEQAANSGGSSPMGCDQSPTNPPHIGKTDSVDGPYLLATYGDSDGASVQANIRYWNYTTNSTKTTVSDAIDNLTSANKDAGWHLPSSYTSGMADGTIVAWQAQSETGSGSVGGHSYGPYTSAWTPSAACYFAVYPSDPDAPTLTADGFSQTTAQGIGDQIKFTITQSSGDTATEFVWQMDGVPAGDGDVPADQTCTTTAATDACTKITDGSATLTLEVPSAGPHDLWVYERDAGGNDSGTTNGAPAGQSWTFSGAGDPDCAQDSAVCFTSDDTLQKNFQAALGAEQSFDNTMISKTSGSNLGCASDAGDGAGRLFDGAQLNSAGWTSGGTLTVDGASFTLPSYGSCTADNVLSANQTIGTGSSGASGSALVFLATSSYAFVGVGGVATDSPDSGPLYGTDPTVPAVMGGTEVSGNGCTAVDSFNPTTTEAGLCVPATGTIDYASGCIVSQQSYTLTVPDWWAGPSDISALTLPDVVESGTPSAQAVHIYAFAVPIDAACTVTSVSLPDVGAQVNPTISADGVSVTADALHIFGMTFRNNTTATPEANGTQAATPAGQAWTGDFEAPIEDAWDPASSGSSFGNQTIRMSVDSNVTVPEGAQVRIRLTDPGFTSPDGAAPLTIGAATIATSFDGSIPGQTPIPLTFGGSSSVTIPEGGDVYSDPLTLKEFGITAGQTTLLISIWLENLSITDAPIQAWPSGASEYQSAYNSGNQTGDTTGTPFSSASGGTWNGATMVLTGVDVTTPEVTQAGVEVSPGEPTVVVAGDNVVDGWTSGNKASCDCLDNPSERLAGQLASQGLAPGYGVVDAGVADNEVLADVPIFGGMSLLARLDRDVLAEPDVGTVVLDEGLEDVLTNASSSTLTSNLKDAYQVLASELGAFGINVIVGDLTPCGGYSSSADSCSTTVDTVRQAINTFIDGASIAPGGSAPPPCPALFDEAVGNGQGPPEALQAAYNAGDDLNLTLGASGGYAALAPAVAATGCIGPNIYPLPASS